MQDLALRNRNRGVVRVRGRPGAGHRRRVDDVGPGIQLGLRHLMAGRVLPGLADIQQIVLVGVADIEGAGQHRRLVGRERIVHHHTGNRRVALVGHRQRVADRLAGHVGRAARNRSVLLDVQDLALRNRHRGVVAVRGRPGAGHRRRVDDGGPGVELGLRHLMAGRVLPGLADIQQIVLVGVAALKVPNSTGASLVVNGSSTTTPAIAALPWLVTASV